MFFVYVKSKLFCGRHKNDEDKSSKRIKITVAVSAAVVLLLAGWMIYVSLHMPSYSYCEGVGKYSLAALTEDDREGLFEQFGFEAEETESWEVIIPSVGEVLQEYNEIQKNHGMNLLPYGDKRAQMYVYKAEKGGEDLLAYLVVYRGKAVAAHISGVGYPAGIQSLKG